ncbi:ABC transporter permease [Virgisporangium aliadipatigenens]|uniref:ABC transporter permease n=1 Tax=Virgisporangium aliadipatigenens TaxID=741659 RepID=A0A8J4DP08_9ACTN|nr:ABC transporter permease subunit [Virgisporangium aliadipatigenens]GIJ45024.1 ABC transporter permease [Virgisporangium aliadipatigenens]
MSWYGVRLVVAHEFRVRLRTGRWQWLFAAWAALVGCVAFSAYLAYQPSTDCANCADRVGPGMFGLLMFFVLTLVLLISPALTAQSINGDRERGTLALLQVTTLSATDIALGKLFAGWLVGLAALGVTLPAVAWTVVEGVGALRAVTVVLVVGLLIGVVCAVSLGLSAALARGTTSTMMSYLTVFALLVGTPLVFALSVVMISGRDGASREDLVWGTLAPNPFVIIADAAPQPVVRRGSDDDMLHQLSTSVRELRRPPGARDFDRRVIDPPVWPYGLGFDLLLGAGGLALARHRLRTPARTVPSGVRVA